MWNLRAIVALTFVSLAQCSDPFTDGKALPKTIILDLDHTIWNAYLDKDFVKMGGTLLLERREQPFTYVENGQVKDKKNIWQYSTDLGKIITAAKGNGIKLAVASKSPNGKDLYSAFLKSIPAPKEAGCIDSTIYSCFDIVIIQAGDKVASLSSVAQKTGAHPSQMILYDDDKRNGEAATTVGVYMHLVGTGGKGNEQLISMEMVKTGIIKWRSKSASAATSNSPAKGSAKQGSAKQGSAKQGGTTRGGPSARRRL